MKTGKSIRGALSYNENKVRQGSAELILASRFSGDAAAMGFTQKLARFEKLTQLNEKSQTNTLHLSLNFSPDDLLDTELMQQIALDYMERIGFGKQPFLVYHHTDTTHPHLHIVTTTIRPDGKPIYLHNIGKNKSEPARKAIELEYHLIKAESKKVNSLLPLQPVALQAVRYGQEETKRAISNIVLQVIATYKFTSIQEFNAVLRQYNIMADHGNPHSKMYQNRGLTYTILDKEGYKIGIPIKASSIYSSPTLNNLDIKFNKSKIAKAGKMAFADKTIKYALAKSSHENQFITMLHQTGINCQFVKSSTGQVSTICFIDNKSKTVFSHHDLGLTVEEFKKQFSATSDSFGSSKKYTPPATHDDFSAHTPSLSLDTLKNLLAVEHQYDDLSPEFLKKKKKRKKRRPS